MNRSTDSVKISQASRGSIHLRTLNIIMIVLALALAIALMVTMRSTRSLVHADPEATILQGLILRQHILTILLLVVIVINILCGILLILVPMRKYIEQIRENETLTMRGAYELRYLAEAYNLMVEENRKHNDSLRYMVEHDHMTGLLNRGAFDRLRREKEHDAIALLLIDVDRFKDVNDTYGHDIGDQVLQRVAYLLGVNFRTTDFPCRIGGDEFAVIMTDMNPSLDSVILGKLEKVGKGLQNVGGGLPDVTLSVGVAFSRQCRPEDDIFRLADAALYRIKGQGRAGCAIYDPALDAAAVASREKTKNTEN